MLFRSAQKSKRIGRVIREILRVEKAVKFTHKECKELMSKVSSALGCYIHYVQQEYNEVNKDLKNCECYRIGDNTIAIYDKNDNDLYEYHVKSWK